VRKGVPIDYSDTDVTAENFLAVLEGAARKVAGHGSGRVVASGPADRVLVVYSGHGAAGALTMPSGPFLFADQLLEAASRKRAANGYGDMVM
jgi:legumain